jgi:hypothetical protein
MPYTTFDRNSIAYRQSLFILMQLAYAHWISVIFHT